MLYSPMSAMAAGENIYPSYNHRGNVGMAGKYWAIGAFDKLQLPEISAPSTSPPADTGWLYVVTGAGSAQTLYFKDNAGTATNLLQAGTWDTLTDPAANGSISFGTYTNTFTSSLTNGVSHSIENTGNMTTGGVLVNIEQKTGNADTNAILLRIKAADTDPKAISIYTGSEVFSVSGAGNIVGTQITVASTVLDVNSLDFVGAGAITTGASTALTLNVAGGDAAGEDLIITANNISLTAVGLMTFSPDAALAIAIDASTGNIATALNVGANDIVGTTGLINYTNFDVNADGDVTCVDLTASGTVSIGTLKQDNLVPATGGATTITLNGSGAGGVTIGGGVGTTGTITLGGAATLVSLPANTDLTLAGGVISVTDAAASTLLTLVNNTMTTTNIIAASSTSISSGKIVSAVAGANFSGDVFYAQATDASNTGYFFRAYNGTGYDFSIAKHGATVIAGDASGTDALTLTNGDILVTAGHIDITTGNFSIVTGFIALGADPADAGAIRMANATAIVWEDATELSLTHVDNTGLLLNSTHQLQFGDSGTYINQSADGVLNVASDTEVKILVNDEDLKFTKTGANGVTVGTNTGVTLITISPAISVTGGIAAGATSTFTTSITPTVAGASTIGTTALEWGNVYLTDSAIIYAQANQGNTLTSSGTGWTANLAFTAPTLVATATASLTLGASGVAGQAIFNGGTSGTITLTPTAIAGTTVLTLPATTGTLAKLENTLGDFAATTSAQLYGKISDETGSGSGTPLLVFNQAPTIASPAVTKAVVDGSAALSLSAAQVSDSVITNTGQIVGDVNHTLPAAAAGYSFVGLVGQTLAGTNYWRFTANTTPTPDDYVCLNGTCGKLYASVDTPTRGDKITCHTAKIASTGIKTGGALAIGSTTDKVANGAFEFDAAGQGYAETADAVGTELNAITTPQNKYGAQALDIGADGTIDPISCTNIATGFDSAVEAAADLPASAASHARIGYVTAMRSNVAGFVWGTTGLDDAETTEAFTSSTAYTPPYGWICTSDQGTWTTN